MDQRVYDPIEQLQRARQEGRYADIADLIPDEHRGEVHFETWFPTIISIMDAKDYRSRNRRWISQILGWRAQDRQGIVRSNSRGWHSTVDMHTREEFIPMGQQFLLQAEEVGRRMGLHEDCEPFIGNMWANVSPHGAHNRNHNHPGTILSLAYYLQTPPGCGKIWFTDPRVQAHLILPPYASDRPRVNEMLNEVFYEPIPGRCIMFPSWLLHEVQPNLTEVEGDDGLRVSVSANISFRMKSGKGKMPAREGLDHKGILTKGGVVTDF
ncbi:MAG TPA: TIGR02466 family protein [Gammaproteobacteria bacterium]|nr:TIGR02466 family protein [Gammaproteobacteria bacterium]